MEIVETRFGDRISWQQSLSADKLTIDNGLIP